MLVYWIWLSIRKLSEREQLAVLSHFGSPEDVYYATDFASVCGLDRDSVASLLDKSLEEAEKILQQANARKISVLTWEDTQYPVRLRSLVDPPLVLYYRGQLPDFSNQAVIGVVGTRKASAYGLRTVRRMGAELTACGALMVSGMAAGVDKEAAEGVLSQGGTPVGVLGCGVDRVYPAGNWRLYEKVERQGCLISEFVPGTPAYKWNFPKRNRIISGLSDGVVVIEAPKVSGALITARRALEQGRDVFVVPGNVDVSSCEGSNALLKEGASMAASGWDVVSEYAARYANIPEQFPVEEKIRTAPPERIDNSVLLEYSDRENGSEDDKTLSILQVLGTERVHINVLIERTGLTSGELMSTLTLLEIQGQVQTQPGGWVEKL